jgi:hypothetical protein
LFEELLARYEGEEGGDLPAWPRILAEKLIEKVEEERAPEEQASEAG